jgi:hypothetical protein
MLSLQLLAFPHCKLHAATATPRAATPCKRCLPPRASIVPIDGLGMAPQRQLGELTFSEVTSFERDAEAVVRGASAMDVGPEQAVVGLFYGELTSGDSRGARVLIKAYSSEANNALAAAAEGADRMRSRLESALGSSDDTEQRGALEAAFDGRGSISVAEALAMNEYTSHCRVQAAGLLSGGASGDVERRGLLPMIGRIVPKAMNDGEPRVICTSMQLARTLGKQVGAELLVYSRPYLLSCSLIEP